MYIYMVVSPEDTGPVTKIYAEPRQEESRGASKLESYEEMAARLQAEYDEMTKTWTTSDEA